MVHRSLEMVAIHNVELRKGGTVKEEAPTLRIFVLIYVEMDESSKINFVMMGT